jgi:DNA-binding transcriptional ArsR family regulator
MNELIFFGRCLSDPVCVRIIVLLQVAELNTARLLRILQTSRAVTQARLARLREAGLVECEYEGKWLVYRLRDRSRPIIDDLLHLHREALSWDAAIAQDYAQLRIEMPDLSAEASTVHSDSKHQ